MIAEPLGRVLEATGYLVDGERAAPGVTLAGSGAHARLPSFDPDAWWRSDADADRTSGGLTVYFKYVDDPEDVPIADWQREIWNQGFAPLLWLVSPEQIELYNGFGTPRGPGEANANRLDTFRLLDEELVRLDAHAGRLAMETGRFWSLEPRVSRETTVDGRLSHDLRHLERALVAADLETGEAQALIGRCLFAKYLIDRKIVTGERLITLCGHADLRGALGDPAAAKRLFAWLRETFSGDMFPSRLSVARAKHLDTVVRFLSGEDLETGQIHFFPYRFDVIPVELVSAIYEQFVRWSASDYVYDTPLAAVPLVLDEVFDGLTGTENVLDLACGSGVFLVEALRRLVRLKSNGRSPIRRTIRETLYNQVYGVDVSETAVRIAAFSLYLAALELDPDPQPPTALRFEPLQGKTLLAGDARTIERTPAGRAALTDGVGVRKFDVIVGNPPWIYHYAGRDQSLDFVARARDFAHAGTRFGMILSATPFFNPSATDAKAVRDTVDALAPVTLINLSDLSGWLFPGQSILAVAFLARHRRVRADRLILVQTHWSPAGERSHTIEIAPSDVTSLSTASWERDPRLFNAAFLGQRPDLLLLDELWEKYEPLETSLKKMGVQLGTGSILNIRPEPDLFFTSTIEDMQRPVAVGAPGEWNHSMDCFYSASFFHSASFFEMRPTAVDIVAGILRSALASWYFLMIGSTIVWPGRKEVVAMPAPALKRSLESAAGQRVVGIVRTFHDLTAGIGARKAFDDAVFDWKALDDAVFDLYELDDADRIVVHDGLFRARRSEVGQTAHADDLRSYASAFLSTMDAWLSASNRRRMRAEICDVPPDAPHRVVRFVLENQPGPSVVKVVQPDGPLRAVLERIGERTDVRVAEALVGLRELRVHARDEVSIVKPAALRHWLGVCGLEDADAVVRDGAHGGRPA